MAGRNQKSKPASKMNFNSNPNIEIQRFKQNTKQYKQNKLKIKWITAYNQALMFNVLVSFFHF